MAIPNKGWLPAPLNGSITQFTLPETFQVYYYVCNPGPYDPLQPWEKPQIEFITINQEPFADSGWKKGAWGWVAGIHWQWAYGDALIESIWPPDEPSTFDERCPGNDDVTDDVCPPELVVAADVEAFTTFTPDVRTVPTITPEYTSPQFSDGETRATPVLNADDRPA